MPLLSVIVPVYNAENYIAKCIESILQQSFEDLELIIIDDGSTDGSFEICNELAQKNTKIRLFRQSNCGVSSARNIGLEYASGKYIGFIDADDTVNINMYSEMITAIEDNDCDLVICGFDYIDKDGKLICNNGEDTNKSVLLNRTDLLELAFTSNQKVFYGSVWNKIFKASIVKTLTFDLTISLFEDWLWIIRVYQKCSSGFIIDRVHYHYLTNKNYSQSNTCDGNKILRSLYKEFLAVYELDESHSLRAAALSRFLDDSTIYLKKIRRINLSRARIRKLILKAIVRGRREKLISKTQRNKYLVEGVFSK